MQRPTDSISEAKYKKIFEKIHCAQDSAASNNSVHVIVTYAVVAFT